MRNFGLGFVKLETNKIGSSTETIINEICGFYDRRPQIKNSKQNIQGANDSVVYCENEERKKIND